MHPFIGAINGLEAPYIVFISLDTLVMRAAPLATGPGGLVPNALVPGTQPFLPSVSEMEGALKLLARGLPSSSGVKLGWVTAQVLFGPWSLINIVLKHCLWL